MPASIELDELIDPHGNTFSLNNGKTRAVLSEAGGGTPPLTYLVSRGPLQDGATLRGYRLDPRAYIMLIRWQGCTRDQYWQMRARLLDRVRPNRQVYGTLNPYTLRKYLTVNGVPVLRDLYVMIGSGPEFVGRSPQQWDEQGFTETLRWIAYDPTWYDPTAATYAITGTTSEQLIFPITFPITFGATYQVNIPIVYDGTWPTFPTIILEGPFSSAIIDQGATGERIVLNYVAAVGETVTFDLAYGAKSVTLNDGTNLIQYVGADSDLGTFHLEPAPTAPGGSNTIQITMGSIGGATPAQTVTFQNRYFGI